jgi:Rrf2 family transcriptional regulator, iron-sulfur cluster assembly transcription factor
LKLSRESYYGLQALSYMTTCKPGTILQADELAQRTELPGMFLAKILYKLARHGVLRSFRGRERGYTLAREPKDITVREVVEIFEGSDVFERCVFWSNECSDREPCPLHEMWRTVRPVVASLMERITLDQVASGKHVPVLWPAVARPRSRTAPGRSPRRLARAAP